MERTFILIKPEGIKRRLVGEIISRFEKKGLYIADCKLVQADKTLLEEHYGELKAKPFFNSLVSHMSSGAVLAMVLEGENVVSVARKLIGATNPAESEVGTIRADLASSIDKNVVHGSDSKENAEKEIKLWFKTALKGEQFENAYLY
ncbi:Nucleoside [Nucleospora cyclopteri]